MKRNLLSSMILSLFCLFAVAPLQAESRKPLLMEGKHSLYQRVLSRPGALLHVTSSEVDEGIAVQPFTVYHVYDRKQVEGRAWVRVGLDSHGGVAGWIPENDLIDWNQTLTVAFRDPLGHDRVMLFRDRESLKKLVDTHDRIGYRRLYKRSLENHLDADAPVIAIQPKAYLDIQEAFYLVPILQHEDIYLGEEQARLLQVASVPLAERSSLPDPSDQSNQSSVRSTQPLEPVAYRSGIVFVIDTTLSMGLYIDRTREAVRKVYDAIKHVGLQDKVSFGLVAYRDTLKGVPDLAYVTKIYATLEEGRDPKLFFEKVASVQPAETSSRGFIEDPYAGIKTAIETMPWEDFAARYIVLITDAGARLAHDPLSQTSLRTEDLRQMARDRQIAIWALHLLTPIGKGNHVAAREQYQQLTLYPDIGHFYYGVQMGRVDTFGRVLERLTAQITRQVRETAHRLPPQPVPEETTQIEQQKQPSRNGLAQLQRRVAKLGYALRMRYLQKVQGKQAPTLFNAWLVDRDFEDPQIQALDVKVLLTRNQLSDLQVVLKTILETAEEGVLSPRNFLNDLKSVAATLSRDPESVSRSTQSTGGFGQNLADLGYMREYIEDLPYRGEVMRISLEDWETWTARQQIKFLHTLESKINYYQALHDNPDLWVSLNGGAVTGDSVFPLDLSMLP